MRLPRRASGFARLRRSAARAGTGALLAVGLLTSGGVYGLPSDREQPIEIRARHAEIDDARGVAVYSGNVTMDQGSLSVTADKLTIHTDRDDVVRVVAEGDRAHYEQRPEPGAALVRADARRIVYHTREQRVELEGDARLAQASDEFTGEVILYDLREHRVQARSGDGAPVRMVIEPGRLGSPLRSGDDNSGDTRAEDREGAQAPAGPPAPADPPASDG